jgi:hypothetical protein
MKILRILVLCSGCLITGIGNTVLKRECKRSAEAFFRLKISGTHLVFINMVFHRILDFKTGLHFYAGPFYFTGNSQPLQMNDPVYTPEVNIIRKFDRI